eukprot:TRINITY_DN10688_c0_g1_i1.p1 TRINITY_DN10688_c0_g1~~TRINITY_DN10688_c0_g1_i1.p1  ORF type:complete len:256 (-),score=72.71 TRINITY_DN10688_c0_g1_i1:61-786(-)
MPYQLYYWPGLQGRGEFIRLALEEANAQYEDVARDPAKGAGAIVSQMKATDNPHPPLAPPFLVDGDFTIAQTANILMYLGEKHDLAPKDTQSKYFINQLQLCISDFVGESHDVHHPIASALYYEDQKDEASKKAKDFRERRIPYFFNYFEKILAYNKKHDKGNHLAGMFLTYVDLSLFQVVEGIKYAFPKAAARALKETPLVVALAQSVKVSPNIARYLTSPRRLTFNESGVFRYYPELDE